MGVAYRLIQQLRKPAQIYTIIVSLAGVLIFVTTNQFAFRSYSLSTWVMVYAMVATVLILEHFVFQLPPEGNQQSMDSSIYLACVFVYGASFALSIQLIGFIIMAIYNRKMLWWKHLVNFAIYTCMISGAAITYHLFGGQTGLFDTTRLSAYLISLSVYFLINIFLVGYYYYLLYKGTLFQIIKDFIKEALFAYLTTLLLALVLVILLKSSGLFGLFLFLAIGILLSNAFRHTFSMYNEMREKVNKDQRTGLFSHSYFEQKLDIYLKEYRENDTSFALALLDLDDFKKYNDAFGHPQGDRLLSHFGKLVREEIEATDILVSRYGGEEFSIIMPRMNAVQAYEFINELRKKVNDTPFAGVEVFPHGCISFSAGVLEMKKEFYDKSHLVDMADQALYTAKSKGKNTIWIYGEQNNLSTNFNIGNDINEIEQHIKIFLAKDVYTYKHSKRVFSYAVEMAKILDLNEDERRLLILGSLIHDIGKLEIPRDVLNKKGKLTNDEWEMIKKHVLWGKEIVLATGKYKELVPLIELHHERYDGKGYPHGLKGCEIPRLARMLCVIDSFDAMTTERPYQKTKSIEEAIEELGKYSGTQFDPELAGYFIEYIEGKFNGFGAKQSTIIE
jgi:diguanylate cyclase (GGDEF)-like protein/putative nucleotidyltransferase with HDIG domain